MKDLVKLKSNVHNIRSGVTALYVPNVKSQSKYNFGYSGTIIWNKLPSKIQKITCKSSFKSETKNTSWRKCQKMNHQIMYIISNILFMSY